MLRNQNVALQRQSDAHAASPGVHDGTGTGADAADVDRRPRQRARRVASPSSSSTGRSRRVGAQGRGIDLQLSGHTHGGQIWPFRYAVRLQQPVIDGLNVVGDVPVITSRGAGAWGRPCECSRPPDPGHHPASRMTGA